MKSAYYTAVVTNAYRHAIDQALAGEPLDPLWVRETERCSHRPYTTGFYYDEPGQHYAEASYFSTAEIAAVVQDCENDGMALLTQRNKFSTGDPLELLLPEGAPVAFTAGELFNEEGERIEDTRRAMMPFRMRLPVPAPSNCIVRKVLDKTPGNG